MEIIVDDRERHVVPHLEDYSHKFNINYKVQRCQVGDYALAYKGYVLLILERKTWADLAASMRDGRKHNVKKLIAARESTNCQLAYLIEGDATPKPDKKFGRLPVKNLRAHLDHLAFRDGIHMIYSKDEEYTASRLFELAQNYLTMKETIAEIDNMETSDEKNILQEKTGSCDVAIHEQILRCLPGVGSVLSALLSENDISLYSLYHELHSTEDIATIKYNTGAMIGMVKGKKIAEGTKKIMDSISTANDKVKIRILSTIPLISKATAAKILDTFSFADLLDGKVELDDLAAIKRTEKTKLGKKAAENIFKHLLSRKSEDADQNAEDQDVADHKEQQTKDIQDNQDDEDTESTTEHIQDLEDDQNEDQNAEDVNSDCDSSSNEKSLKYDDVFEYEKEDLVEKKTINPKEMLTRIYGKKAVNTKSVIKSFDTKADPKPIVKTSDALIRSVTKANPKSTTVVKAKPKSTTVVKAKPKSTTVVKAKPKSTTVAKASV